MNRNLLPICLILAAALSASAQDDLPRSTRPIEGKPFAATLERLQGGTLLLKEGDEQRELQLGDLLVWGSPAGIRKGSYNLLSDGSTIAAEIRSLAKNELVLESSRRPGLWKASSLPRAQLRAIVYQASASAGERERFEWQLLSQLE